MGRETGDKKMAFGQGKKGSTSGGRFRHRLARTIQSIAALFSLLLAFPLEALAQAPQPILTNPVPQGSPIPRILPPGSPGVSIEGITPPAPEAGTISGPPVT